MSDSMAPLLFLAQVVAISLSGVMAPGPVTAATIAMGTRSRYAGMLVAIGHGAVEFPLIVLIVFGTGQILKLPVAQISIGLAGGVFLLMMGTRMLGTLRSAEKFEANFSGGTPLLTGVLLSATNPYFLFWWATIGLALATTASGLGAWAFVLFAVVHWLCDFIWLSALSWASFKGSALLGPRIERVAMLICALAVLFFGLYFVYRAAMSLARNL